MELPRHRGRGASDQNDARVLPSDHIDSTHTFIWGDGILGVFWATFPGGAPRGAPGAPKGAPPKMQPKKKVESLVTNFFFEAFHDVL